LAEFLSVTLDPYLYAVTIKMETGRPFVFGELRHGGAGVVQDLAERLRIPESAVPSAFMPRRPPLRAATGQWQ
jgi:hypothetical protein